MTNIYEIVLPLGVVAAILVPMVSFLKWLWRNVQNWHYKKFDLQPQQNELRQRARSLDGIERCLILWMLSPKRKRLGISISYGPNDKLLKAFISLRDKELIMLNENGQVSGVWDTLDAGFYPGDDAIIRDALSVIRGHHQPITEECQAIYDTLARM
ncbi:hypothetical protein HF923_01225 [Acidithiobacillus ferriphilus]|uniref:hypothetical protein n=1 Tax=Acidithiobacillus ferriphilus TaxID=1689834 RepID=UPI001C07C4E9|nr:hypothetical protein [Acidithiobacillus ferriphilus]MBU2844472.1 hypothetical protein [Acidithiobacillus ferriphilus]